MNILEMDNDHKQINEVPSFESEDEPLFVVKIATEHTNPLSTMSSDHSAHQITFLDYSYPSELMSVLVAKNFCITQFFEH